MEMGKKKKTINMHLFISMIFKSTQIESEQMSFGVQSVDK
jgi:hypothetical protein